MKQLLQICFTILIIQFSATALKAQSNQYLDFDGVDDFVTVPNASSLIAGSTSFSMTGWFWDNALTYGQGMMGFRNTNAGFYMIELNNGQIEARMQNSAGTLFNLHTANYVIVPNTWQHYAWVYNGSTCKLYLNGNLIGTINASGTITSTTTPFAIGKSILSGFNFVYSGRIDEVSVWNKALSQTEIQDMIANELVGNEPNLQLYYKFNQGVPGGNNTSIASLTTAVNSPLYDGVFNNFALNGATSNFNGTLNSSFQAISFPQIPPQLTTYGYYKLNATATSGLPVSYTVLSGPASLSNDTLYFSGPGSVSVQADQYGNAQYDTAVSVINTFDIVDPMANLAVIDARNPVDNADIFMPSLGTLELASVVTIQYPSLFNVTGVQYVINGNTIQAIDHGNSHYTAFWTPSGFGPTTITINATSNYGAVKTINLNVNVVQTISNIDTVPVFSNIWLNASTPSDSADAVLPSFVGAFDTILVTLSTTCPPIGCNQNYDRVASIDIKGKDGKWLEIIRYITPYDINGTCTHTINLADYMSLLQGKVWFRMNCSTLDNGFSYTLKVSYRAGNPPHKYSKVTQIWKAIYPFGDPANLNPVPTVNYNFMPLTVASTLKLVSTGHGWGNNNTGNAAEFYNTTHNIWVNGANTFSQHNWTTCNPNPDACSPQGGTWTYNRAGWCPGSIARYFDYDLTSFVSNPSVSLQYIFNQNYTDQCHPNNPNCVSGVTCPDCSDGFNPVLDVNCNLVSWYDDASALAIREFDVTDFVVYPNPSAGLFYLASRNEKPANYKVSVYNMLGNLVKEFEWKGGKATIDMSNSPKGLFIIKVSEQNSITVKKVLLQ